MRPIPSTNVPVPPCRSRSTSGKYPARCPRKADPHSGLDRIDIHIDVPAVKYQDLAGEANGETSDAIRQRVEQARAVQLQRFEGNDGVIFNADMEQQEIKAYCRLDDAGQELLKRAITQLGLSARAYDWILKVSRTIADLEGCENIQPGHVGEAIQYRSLDRNLWNG